MEARDDAVDVVEAGDLLGDARFLLQIPARLRLAVLCPRPSLAVERTVGQRRRRTASSPRRRA
jgi:hypothetical protein